MVVKMPGAGLAKLERRIECVKYTLFCFSAIMWLITPFICAYSALLQCFKPIHQTLSGSGMFGLSMWLRLEPGFQEWVDFLQISEFYMGIDILIFASVLIIVASFCGCASALMENQLALLINIGLQALSFVFGLAGSAVLLDYSTYDSQIQPLIRKSMTNLIINSQHEHVSLILRMVQENIGCCGADGPMDYSTLLKPLPTECRDTVTGNAFFHGCVEELTWFLEARSGWLAGLALALCMIHVIQAVCSLILIQAITKEEEGTTFKR